MPRYTAWNSAAPTIAAPIKVTTGTVIKTMLQIATPATRRLQIVEWGISFDGSAAATPLACELLQTDVAATVTAHLAAGLVPHDSGETASLMTLGVSATGFTATAEGTTTASRLFDAELVAPTNQYIRSWEPGRGPSVAISKFLRVRVTAAAAVSCLTFVTWDE